MRSTEKKDSWTVINDDRIFQNMYLTCDVHKDRYILLAGGDLDEGDDYISSVTMYDTYTKSYTALPALTPPFPESILIPISSLVLNGYFYVLTNRNHMYRTIYRICLSKRLEWELLINDRNMDAIVTDGNNLFLLNRIGTIYHFNPSTKDYITLNRRDVLDRDLNFATAVVDKKIYFIGGDECEMAIEDVDVFALATISWNQAPPLPRPLLYASAVAVDRWIIVTGGQHETDDYDSDTEEVGVVFREMNTHIYVYDTLTQQWTINKSASFSPRAKHCSVKLGSQIISMGGRTVDFQKFPMEAIHIQHIISDYNWSIIKSYILLRALIDQKRAVPIITTATKNSKSNKTGLKLDADVVIEQLFTNISIDVFRYVLSYMI